MNQRRVLLKTSIAALIVVSTLSACSKKEAPSVAGSPNASSSEKKTVVALLPGVVDPFYATMHRGAEKAASEENIELLYQVPKAWNTTEQVPILKALIARKPDVLLIAPVDKEQMIVPLKEAVDAGIKVITVDTYIGTGKYQTGSGNADFPLSYIASDNVEGGRIAARALAKAIGEKGKVYCSSTKPGISSTDERLAGFLEEMKKYPNIQVLETQYNDDDSSKASAQVGAVLARHPDLVGIFGANVFSGKGSSEGVRKANKQGVVKLIAFDAIPGIDQDIKNGLIDMAIAQKPLDIGYWGVKFAADVVKGKKVDTFKGTDFSVLDKNNIDDPEMKKLIYSN